MAEQSDSQLDETREARTATAAGVSEPGAVVPPYDMGAEQSLLGSFIVDNATVDEVMDYLKPDDFYFDEHVTVCDCIFRLRPPTASRRCCTEQ